MKENKVLTVVAVLFAVDDTWTVGWLLACWRRVVALGSDVAEEDDEDRGQRLVQTTGGRTKNTRRVYSSGIDGRVPVVRWGI